MRNNRQIEKFAVFGPFAEFLNENDMLFNFFEKRVSARLVFGCNLCLARLS